MELLRMEDTPDSLVSNQCQDCNFVGKNVTVLRRHVTTVHVGREKKPFKCELPGCDYRARKKNSLYVHVRTVHTKNIDQRKVFKCDECDYKVGFKCLLRQHAIIHSNERPFVCDFPSCSYRARRARDMKQHKKRHYPDSKVYSCPFCGHRSRTKSNLAAHIRTHTRDKPYTCDFPGCNYRARQSGNLSVHRRRHNPEEMLTCDFPGCGYQTVVLHTLRNHQETHNPERRRDFLCPLCPKTFVVKYTLQTHVNVVHTNEQRLNCTVCGIIFRSRSNLRSHIIRAHAFNSDRPGMRKISKKYECTACDYRSTHRGNVLQHQQRRHSKVKEFACDKCKYRGKCKTALVYHQYRCPGIRRVKSFECQVCKKKYFTKQDLIHHLNTVHREDRPHKCHHCEFTTNHPSSLRTHLYTQHPQNPTKSQDRVREPTTDQLIRPIGGSCRIGGQLISVGDASADKQKRFTCDFAGCSFSTSYSGNLGIHKRRHSPEMKNCQCSLCPRKFFCRSELNIHIRRVHAKERPFSCELCEYTAATETAVRLHKITKHDRRRTARVSAIAPEKDSAAEQLGIAETYSCPFCSYIHAEYMDIVRHTVTHRFVVVSLERLCLVSQ